MKIKRKLKWTDNENTRIKTWNATEMLLRVTFLALIAYI